ncbi:hypothetical protein [Polaromonas sp.]|uniref:hypothetical protein n=1 Tax=Polaromonas sp. TaxID=1869339 RepID=UPI003526A01A
MKSASSPLPTSAISYYFHSKLTPSARPCLAQFELSAMRLRHQPAQVHAQANATRGPLAPRLRPDTAGDPDHRVAFSQKKVTCRRAPPGQQAQANCQQPENRYEINSYSRPPHMGHKPI